MLVKGRRTRRLQIALNIMADRGQITRSLAGVMREAYPLPNRMAAGHVRRSSPRTRLRPLHLSRHAPPVL